MKLKLIQYPNPLLNQKSKKVSIIDSSIKKLADDMAETMATYGSEHESGVALAAIQVGVPLRMTVIKEDQSEKSGYFPLINPEIIKSEGEELDVEGCMSVPQKYGKVPRFQKIKVRGLNLDGKKIEIRAEGLLARILQHEIDHMDGKLFLNHVPEKELLTLDKDGKLVRE